MKRSGRWMLIALWTGAACGGFQTDPWQPGEARIEITLLGELEPTSAWAAVIGEDTDAVRPEPGTQRFVVSGVAAPGRVEVVVSDGLGGAARRQVDVLSDRVSRVEVSMGRAAEIEGTVTLEGPAERVQVQIDDLPVRTEVTGTRFVLGGLPAGCFDVEAEADGHRAATVRVCVDEGERVTTGLHLRLEDVEPCGTCSADDQCDGLCVEHPVEQLVERVCLAECEDDDGCPRGFVCEGDPGRRVCAPEAASCAAYLHLDQERSCVGDGDCGLVGVDDAVCRLGFCTVLCGEAEHCPDETACEEPGEEPGGFCR